jgi:hypothetical protein
MIIYNQKSRKKRDINKTLCILIYLSLIMIMVLIIACCVICIGYAIFLHYYPMEVIESCLPDEVIPTKPRDLLLKPLIEREYGWYDC